MVYSLYDAYLRYIGDLVFFGNEAPNGEQFRLSTAAPAKEVRVRLIGNKDDATSEGYSQPAKALLFICLT